jgi:hypothetical protein
MTATNAITSSNAQISLKSTSSQKGLATLFPKTPYTESVIPAGKIRSIPTRHEKNLVSKNCLLLLKKIVGKLSLEESSKDLLNLPKGESLSLAYKAQAKPAGYTSLKAQVTEIQKIISNSPSQLSECSSYRKKVQGRICEALKHPVYDKLKSYELDPLVHFLHTAADIIHNHSEGSSAFEQLGGRLLSLEDAKEYDLHQLSQDMDKARKISSNASIDTWYERVFTHSIRHWKRALATLSSNRPHALETYNAYNLGNYNAELGTYFIGQTGFRSSAGPNPSHKDYQIFPAIHQRNENLRQFLGDKAPAGYQIILEGAEKSAGPKERRNHILAQQEVYSQTFAMALPLDGDPWKGHKEFKETRTAAEFAAKIERRGHEPLGFIIPQKMMTSVDLKEAGNAFKNAFQHLEGTSTWNDLVAKNQLCKTLLLGYDSILSLKSMVHAAERQPKADLEIDGLKIRSHYNLACKQGIDRGVIMNATLRLFVDALETKQFRLTSKQVKQYCGYTAGRAVNVEARKIQEDRYAALRNLIDLLAAATPENQQQFLASLAIPQIRFEPSHKDQ